MCMCILCINALFLLVVVCCTVCMFACLASLVVPPLSPAWSSASVSAGVPLRLCRLAAARNKKREASWERAAPPARAGPAGFVGSAKGKDLDGFNQNDTHQMQIQLDGITHTPKDTVLLYDVYDVYDWIMFESIKCESAYHFL